MTGSPVSRRPLFLVVAAALLGTAACSEDLAGLRAADYRSGRSLLPSLADPSAATRDLVFFEHTFAPSLGADPAHARTIARMKRALAAFDRCAAFVGDDPLPPRCRRIDRKAVG